MTGTTRGDAPRHIDRYEILDELGRGSMGIVYLAHDPNTDRRVALKLIVPPRAATPEEQEESRARFLLEARAAGRLQHPGIVTLYDADADAGTGSPFLVMEWVDGRSLSALLRERGALPWREAAGIAIAVARALDHAHERGIVHRDVKPANVLLSADGAVKVSDFSIAKIATESHTLTGMVLGTPNYMSPEQVRGEPIDGRSDLFGLGAMLYEMLTGAPPFQSDSIASISYKLVHVEPDRLAAAGRDIPSALEPVVRRALEKDPARRYPSGGELAAALESACRLAGEDTPPPGPAPAPPPRPTPGPAPIPGAIAGAPTVATAGRSRAGWTPLRRTLLGCGLAVVVGLGYWAGQARRAPGPARFPATATAAAPAAAGAPAPSPVPPAPRRSPAAVPAPAREAGRAPTLAVLYFNRLRTGTVTVWVDGERRWTAPLSAPRNLLDRVEGEPVRATLRVTPGTHVVEVHVSQRSGHIDARGSIRGDFTPGRTRLLRVTLVPYVPALGLEWEP